MAVSPAAKACLDSTAFLTLGARATEVDDDRAIPAFFAGTKPSQTVESGSPRRLSRLGRRAVDHGTDEELLDLPEVFWIGRLTVAVGETVILMTAPVLSLLKHLLKVEGGCSRMTVSPTANSRNVVHESIVGHAELGLKLRAVPGEELRCEASVGGETRAERLSG